MVQLTYILFICLIAPLFLMTLLLEKRSRVTVGFMMIGILTCLIAGEINTMIYDASGETMFYASTTFTPIVEEFLKGLPVLYFALFISDKRERLLSVSMAVGIGFAVFENLAIIVRGAVGVNLEFALIRGFSSALVHGICTAAIGYGLSLISKRKKLAVTGTFGLFTASVTYHAVFNALIQSEYSIIAVVLPLLTYIPVVIFLVIGERVKKQIDGHK